MTHGIKAATFVLVVVGGCTCLTIGDDDFVLMEGAGGEAAASSGGGPAMVDCGGMKCEVGAEAACCWHGGQDPKTGDCTTGNSETDKCSTSVEKGVYDSRIECQSQAQCASDRVCCGEPASGNGTYLSWVFCRTTCPDPHVTLCDQLGEEGPDCPLADNGMGMQVQTVCKTSTLLPPGYYVCGQP